MALQASGAISINDIVGEYGGSGSHSLSEYYRGGSFVANHSNNSSVPTSGTISLSNFYGQSNTAPGNTALTYTIVAGSNSTNSQQGYLSGLPADGIFFTNSQPMGSISNNPNSTALTSGFNPTVTGLTTQSVSGKSATTDLTYTVRTATVPNSGWTSIVSGVSRFGTQNRSAATYTTSTSSSNGRSRWNWSTSGGSSGNSSDNYQPGSSYNITINV